MPGNTETSRTAIHIDADQAARDAAYNNSEAVRDSAARVADWERRSAAFRASRSAILDIPYGPAPRNRIDFFASGRENAALFVFIHGGYWQRNSKETFSFIANGPLAHGIDVAVVGYTLAPGASLTAIVAEVMAALDNIYDRAETLGFDPARIHVGGWSAGGHLAALAANHAQVRGVMPISGIFDLAPIARTYINDKVALDSTEIESLSPVNRVAPRRVPYRLYVGGDELPELQRQTAEFAALLRRNGRDVALTTPEGLNHFTIVEELADPSGLLATGLARMVDATA